MKLNRIITGVLVVLAIFALAFRSLKDKNGYPLANLDRSADPCEDFYQYAIGGWQKQNPLPATESRWATFNILNKQNEERITRILDSLSIPGIAMTKGSPEQQVRDFYAALLDTQRREKQGLAPLKEMMEAIEGCSSHEELLVLMADWRKDGIGGFFGLYVGADARNSDLNVLHLGQGGLHLPDIDYYLKQDSASQAIREAYAGHIDRMLEFFQLGPASKEILNLETRLAEVSMSRTDRRDPDKTYNPYTHKEFHEAFAGYDWKAWFGKSGVSEWNRIIVGQPEFLKAAIEIWNRESLETLKHYLRFEVISSFAGVLNAAVEQESFRFYSGVLRGTAEMKPLKERVVQKVNGSLGELVGQLYVKKHFSEESKQRVSLMVEEIRTVFRERINRLDWMGDTTRQKALEKLAAFKYKIGFPDSWKDYSSMNILAYDPVSNQKEVSRLSWQRMLEKIEKPVDRSEWSMTPQTVNAYYSSSKNEIVFPAGILQPPFFDPDVDDALNYGGIGGVIGHEFSHGFDDKGSRFDAAGNLNDWWTAQDRARFNERTIRIVQQFNAFEVLPGVNINGSLTQGENIADLAGITLAYYALERHYGEHPPKGKGIDGFTWQQRFFLGWAQVWAQNISEKELRNRILTDPHSPGRYRVIGPLVNLPEFAAAFSCKGRCAMQESDPEKRVVIW